MRVRPLARNDNVCIYMRQLRERAAGSPQQQHLSMAIRVVRGGSSRRRRENVYFSWYKSRSHLLSFSLPRSTHLVYLSPSVSPRIRGEIGLESPRWLSAAFGRHLPAKLIETTRACTCTARTRVHMVARTIARSGITRRVTAALFPYKLRTGESRRRERRREARNIRGT